MNQKTFLVVIATEFEIPAELRAKADDIYHSLQALVAEINGDVKHQYISTKEMKIDVSALLDKVSEKV